MKVKKRLICNCQISLERDQQPEGIAGNQVARELIPQGVPTIQTTVSMRGYMLASE
jgi:hypothetical protein